MSIEHENLDNIAQIQDESDLEQYGVWVKKTPEEKPANDMRDTHENTDSSDIFLDDIDFDNLPDADISEPAEPESVIDSDLNGKIEETLDADKNNDTETELMAEPADFEDFAADLQGFQMHTEEGTEEAAVSSVEQAVSENDIETFADTSTEDIDWEEYMGDSENPEDSLLDEKPLDINLSFEDNFETITPDFPTEESVSEDSEENFETEDVSEMFTSDSEEDINSETDSPSSPKDEIPDITEIPEMADIGEMEEFAESTQYDFPVDFNARSKNNNGENAKSDETETADSEGPVMENIDINEFNTDIVPPEQDASEQDSAADTVYNIAVHADDESAEEENSPAPAAAENPAVQTMSSALFEKIMGELSLLRQDITDLKTDLNALKEEDTEDIVREEEPAPKTGGGFFSEEEEDETIALSGDELNNILTSADFTAGAPNEDVPEEADNIDQASAQEDENITESDGEPVLNLRENELTEPALDDITFDIDEDNREDLPNEIDIPVSEDLVVDSANDDFFAEDDTPKDIDDTAVNFLSEDPADCEDVTEDMSAPDTDDSNSESDETGNTAPVEEESEYVFNDTDIATAAEDIFSDTAAEKTEVQDSSELDILSDPEEPESDIEEPAAETAEEPPAEEMLIAEENEITEEQTEQEISPVFDADFEEDISEDSSEFAPIEEVFNSKQWISEEEAAAEEAEKAAEEAPAEDTLKTASEADTVQDKAQIPQDMREEIKSVLAYMDQLLENLPEEKIVEFARSEHFPVYKKLFTELGLS